jgi:hypothetical protein
MAELLPVVKNVVKNSIEKTILLMDFLLELKKEERKQILNKRRWHVRNKRCYL